MSTARLVMHMQVLAEAACRKWGSVQNLEKRNKVLRGMKRKRETKQQGDLVGELPTLPYTQPSNSSVRAVDCLHPYYAVVGTLSANM